jgi:ABC-type phosphate transport system substrate-binding protein
MKLKDLTKEQVIEIAKLIYSFWDEYEKDFPNQEIKFTYQPYDATWYEDAREYVMLEFKGYTFGDTVDNLMLQINKNLDVWFYYCRENGAHDLPSRNQHAVQKKFIEWGIEPDYKLDGNYA